MKFLVISFFVICYQALNSYLQTTCNNHRQ